MEGTLTSTPITPQFFTLAVQRSGALSAPRWAGDVVLPYYTAVKGRFVYAANYLNDTISAYYLDSTDVVQLLSTRPCGGANPSYVALDRTGTHVVVANFYYPPASVSVYDLTTTGSFGSGPVSTADVEGFASCSITDPTNRFVLVADYLLGRVYVLAYDGYTGMLGEVSSSVSTGTGTTNPQRIVFGAGRSPRVFVLCQHTGTVQTYLWDDSAGVLTGPTHIVSTRVPPVTTSLPYDMVMHPSGSFLFVCNRVSDTVLTFSVRSDGVLTLVQSVPSAGTFPRSLAMVGPNVLVVANYVSQSVVSFSFSSQTYLTQVSSRALDRRPVSLAVVLPSAPDIECPPCI